jgi:hypothetical protein
MLTIAPDLLVRLPGKHGLARGPGAEEVGLEKSAVSGSSLSSMGHDSHSRRC